MDGMSGQHRDESGEFAEKVSDHDVLEAFDEADAPVQTANELAEELSISRSAMHYRLKRMRDQGLVDRKETGARAVVWWRVDRKTTAEPLRDLVGMLDEDEADQFRERTQEIRDRFDREILGNDVPEREA